MRQTSRGPVVVWTDHFRVDQETHVRLCLLMLRDHDALLRYQLDDGTVVEWDRDTCEVRTVT